MPRARRQTKASNKRSASWYNNVTSYIFQLALVVVLALILAGKTLHWLYPEHVNLSKSFTFAGGWIVIILSFLSTIYGLIAAVQSKNN
jgi:hypothetical protein